MEEDEGEKKKPHDSSRVGGIYSRRVLPATFNGFTPLLSGQQQKRKGCTVTYRSLQWHKLVR